MTTGITDSMRGNKPALVNGVLLDGCTSVSSGSWVEVNFADGGFAYVRDPSGSWDADMEVQMSNMPTTPTVNDGHSVGMLSGVNGSIIIPGPARYIRAVCLRYVSGTITVGFSGK